MNAECSRCGLAPCDLPDEVDPDDIFERGDDGEWYCQVDLPGSANTFAVDIA